MRDRLTLVWAGLTPAFASQAASSATADCNELAICSYRRVQCCCCVSGHTRREGENNESSRQQQSSTSIRTVEG
ncbi:hypothetical protein F5883DRAFT_576325 [Diaporthe sp. PMI_573]|nr:hypothetical protein F5883DRAFT_576325 [Diaporthaceae sp. PMI_573]